MLDGISIETASENLAECTPFLMYFQFLDTTFPKKKKLHASFCIYTTDFIQFILSVSVSVCEVILERD